MKRFEIEKDGGSELTAQWIQTILNQQTFSHVTVTEITEEKCVWEREWGAWDFVIPKEYGRYARRCTNKTITAAIDSGEDWKFCPYCGKPIEVRDGKG